jgi:hypothetical protein
MPNQLFQLYNHAYSFENSKVFSGGITYSLPQSDYGIYGNQVDVYFNTISQSVGATGNLAVWFVADKGLTYYRDDPGASAAVTGYIQGRFPVSASTEGLGLVDLRGAPEWKHLIGDGIIGPTLASTKSVTSYTGITGYVESISTLINLLSTTYPNINWTIAGLPHLPFQMTFAPTGGAAPTWDASLTNNTNYGGWWDIEHPTGNTQFLSDWTSSDTQLLQFYKQIAQSGVQKYLLDNCSIGWICPDIRTPYASNQEFYQYGYNPEANYERNYQLSLIASEWAQQILSVSYSMISPMHPSRGMNIFDSSNGRFLGIQYNENTGLYSIDPASFTGSSGNAREYFYTPIQFRVDMLDAAIQGESNGFVYYDPFPVMLEAAFTGDIPFSSSGYAAQIRGRNTISSMFYGGSYKDGYAPSVSGFADTCAKADAFRYCAKNTIGYLNEIREVVNLENPGSPPPIALVQNGYNRSAIDPNAPLFVRNDDSILTNRPDLSDSMPWGQNDGGNPCCPETCTDPNCTNNQTEFDLSRCTRSLSTCTVTFRCFDPFDPESGFDCNDCETTIIRLDCSNACPCGCDGGTYTITSTDLETIIGDGNTVGSGCVGTPPIQINGLPSNCTINIPPGNDPIWGPYLPQGGDNCCSLCLCPFGFEQDGGTIDCTQSLNSVIVHPTFSNKVQNIYSNDVVSSHDLRNYERSTNTPVPFNSMLSYRKSLSWKKFYQTQIRSNLSNVNSQARDTILSSYSAANAVKIQYEKDSLRYYPGKYFT